MTDHRDDLAHVDDALRALLTPDGNEPAINARHGMSRSRGATRVRLHMAYADGASSWRRVRVAAVVAFAAIAVLVAIALGPGGGGSRSGGGVSALERLTPTASASEVLDTAATLVAEEGAGVGTGDVWHGVTRTYHEDALVSVNEQWFDSAAPRYLQATWGNDTTLEHRDVLLVDRVGDDDVQRIRTYVRPDGGEWQVPADMNPTNAMDVEQGARQRQLVLALHAWLRVVSAEGATADELRAATERFVGGTGDYFAMQGPLPGERWSHSQQQASVRARAAVYLLTTVRATPSAVAELYEVMGGVESMERLSNVEVDGRTAFRLRFDPSDEAGTPHVERVLVLDAETGQVLRTETVDRRSWTEVAAARRVEEIGASRTLCEEVEEVPCDLLEGSGPVADQGDAFVRNMQIRYAVHAENRRLKRELGDAAPETMCLDMSPRGECLPRSEEERQRIEAIAKDVEALRATATFDNATPGTGDDTAFHIGVPIADLMNPSGVWSSSGQCSRDWRELTICRG